MKCLIDTHVLLWYLEGDPTLPLRLADQLDDAEVIVVSIVSLWELTIKMSLQKIELNKSLEDIQKRLEGDKHFDVLNISFKHLHTLASLPHHHKDLFDRLLIAQAISEDIIIFSADDQFHAYPAHLVWK
jgi:PIN domain nuclease of toxin-antitoxin system